MIHSFIFTPEAQADLLAVWEYLAEEASEAIADRVIAELYRECQKLGGTPGLGHHREELLDKRHRFWKVWSYLIVYRWQLNPIQVISIVHGARDLDAIFATK